eukprot:scaffold5290_cov63-Phaeocystis_antarctica.AAC.4
MVRVITRAVGDVAELAVGPCCPLYADQLHSVRVASSPGAEAALQACCPCHGNRRQQGRVDNRAAQLNLRCCHNNPRSKRTRTCWSRPVATQSGESTAGTRPGCPIRSLRCTYFLGSQSNCQQSTKCLCCSPRIGLRRSGPRNGRPCPRRMVWAPSYPPRTRKTQGIAEDAGCVDADSRSLLGMDPRSVSSFEVWGRPSRPAPVRSHMGSLRPAVPGEGPGRRCQ